MRLIMKRAATIFLSLAVLLTFTPFVGQWTGGTVGAEEVYADTETYEYEGFSATYNDGVLTISGSGDIPAMPAYQAPWESRKDDVTKIVIEEGITGLGNYVLYGFHNVEEVSLPSTLNTLPVSGGARGFYLMVPLAKINVAEDSPYFCVVDNVLYNKDMSRLVVYPLGKTDAEFTIPEGVTTIETYGISGNRSLTRLTLPASLTTIESDGIRYIYNLEAFSVAEGSGSFSAQDGILFNKDMTTLMYCPITKTGTYTFPDTVTTLYDGAFQNSQLASIDLNNLQGKIPDFAFRNCKNLTHITIPTSVTSIGYYTFSSSGLTEVVIPASVGELENYAFSYCTDMTAMAILNPDCTIASGSAINGNSENECLIYGLEGSTAQTIAGSRFRAIGPVAVPEGPSMVYNGEKQTAIAESEAYAVTGGVGTNSGSYTATLSLKHAAILNWEDGTTDDKTVTWTIEPKAITPKVTVAAKTYTGNVLTPVVTVKDGTKTLTTANYTRELSGGRKNVGKYKVTVNMRGNYTGTATTYFKINPKGTSLKSLTAGSKSITVKWNKQATKMSTSYITGYQIQIATNSKFTEGVKNYTATKYSTVSKKLTKLKGKKKYYVRIRTYKTVSGTKYYSPWSKSKYVTTKK